MVYNIYTILVLLLSHTQSLPNPGYYLVNVGGNHPLVGRAEIERSDEEENKDNSWDMFGLFSEGNKSYKDKPEDAKKKPDKGFYNFGFIGGDINSTKTVIDGKSKTYDNLTEDVPKGDSESTYMEKLMSLLESIESYIKSGADITTEKFTEWGKSLNNLGKASLKKGRILTNLKKKQKQS